jgi:hypothetical protein
VSQSMIRVERPSQRYQAETCNILVKEYV